MRQIRVAALTRADLSDLVERRGSGGQVAIVISPAAVRHRA